MTDTKGVRGSHPAADRLAGMAIEILAGIAVARPFVDLWPDAASSRSPPPSRLPVLQWLSAATALSAPEAAPFVAELSDRAPELAWSQTYTAAAFGPRFLERYGWTELVGLRGPIGSDRIACGVLMLGPDVDYPSHAHAAEEIYVPLAGTALWQRGDGTFAPERPGHAIHHAAWLPHAMRTQSEPLVALYVWRGGDLAAKPQITTRT